MINEILQWMVVICIILIYFIEPFGSSGKDCYDGENS